MEVLNSPAAGLPNVDAVSGLRHERETANMPRKSTHLDTSTQAPSRAELRLSEPW
jgi:hypothetical protein